MSDDTEVVVEALEQAADQDNSVILGIDSFASLSDETTTDKEIDSQKKTEDSVNKMPDLEGQKTHSYNTTWNQTWDFKNLRPAVKLAFWGTLTTLAIFLVVGLPLIFSSSDNVEFHQNAVLINNRGNIDGAVGPGRHFPGPGGRAVKFERFDYNVEYTQDNGNGLSPRVADGQLVTLDLSFQYSIPKSSLLAIYKEHKTGFDNTMRQVARSQFWDTASRYSARDFFHKRADIEKEMRDNVSREAEIRGVRVTGFQLRHVRLPEELNNQLITAMMLKQDARAGEESLTLETIEANTAKIKLQMETEREKSLERFEQETIVEETKLNQERRKIEEQTKQLVLKVKESGRNYLTLFKKETDLVEERLKLNTSIENETTRRASDNITINAETRLVVFNQETENTKLGYEQEIELINQRASQNVSRIKSQTEQEVEQFKADLEALIIAAQSEARIMLAEVNEQADNLLSQASISGYENLSPSILLAEEIGAGALSHVNFMDANTDNLIEHALEVEGVSHYKRENTTVPPTVIDTTVPDTTAEISTTATTTTV
eukprot:m.45039 g.45039  ORF g.45039 m.45039 type:complete len:547 (-) comp10176_c0_seq2:851-2491(-)